MQWKSWWPIIGQRNKRMVWEIKKKIILMVNKINYLKLIVIKDNLMKNKVIEVKNN